MIGVHPQAVVSPGAKLAPDVTIGPFAVIGPHVELGAGAIVHPHAVIDGHTTLGEGVQVFPFAAIGLPPQDLKYDGSPTRLVVGARTILREYTTLQPGTVGAGGVTTVGEDCLIMAYCHVAHDCAVGNRVIMANATQLAGHVTVEDFAILGGVTTVHQFVRIGSRAITGASARVVMDVPPFTMADGHPAKLFGLNTVGLKRAKMSSDTILALRRAYKEIFVRGPFKEAIARTRETPVPEVQQLCTFLEGSKRGVTRASRAASAEP